MLILTMKLTWLRLPLFGRNMFVNVVWLAHVYSRVQDLSAALSVRIDRLCISNVIGMPIETWTVICLVINHKRVIKF